MKNKSKILKFFLISLLALSFFININLKAQSKIEGVTVSPANFEFNLNNNQAKEFEFLLTNKEDSQINVGLNEAELIENNFVILEQTWIDFDLKQFSMNPNSKVLVKSTITLTDGTASGEYKRFILVNITSIRDSNVLLSIPIPITIINGSLPKKGFDLSPITITSKITLQNKVDFQFKVLPLESSIKPLININILNPSGEIVLSKTLNESLLEYSNTQQFNLNQEFVDINNTSIGQYSIEVLATDTLSGVSKIQKATFFYINPFLIFLIVIIVLTILASFKLKKILRTNKRTNLKNKSKKIGLKK